MGLTQNDEMVQALTADWTDHPLREGVARSRVAAGRPGALWTSIASRAGSPCGARRGQSQAERWRGWTASRPKAVRALPRRVGPTDGAGVDRLIAAAPPVDDVGRHSPARRRPSCRGGRGRRPRHRGRGSSQIRVVKDEGFGSGQL